jgi:hypothetical protein
MALDLLKMLRCMKVEYLNLFLSQESIPEGVNGVYIKLEGMTIEKKERRRAYLQSIVNRLNRKRIDCCVAPRNMQGNFDIVAINESAESIKPKISHLQKLGPRLVAVKTLDVSVISASWQNRLRTHLESHGFLKIGDRYILEKDIRDGSDQFKDSFRIQTKLHQGKPGVYIDPRAKIMTPLDEGLIDKAEIKGDESDIRVRVLPRWMGGILVGRSGFKADDREYPIGNKSYKTSLYWKIKNGIAFVRPDEEMLDVFVPAFDKTIAYPKSCVFSEFKRGTSLPPNLKKSPNQRIRESQDFIRAHLSNISFAGMRIQLSGPQSYEDLGYRKHSYPSSNEMMVNVGRNNTCSVRNLHRGLKASGPYAGNIDGKYIVIHSGRASEAKRAMRYLENIYKDLGLGILTRYTGIGEEGIIHTGGPSSTDFTSTIIDLRSDIEAIGEKILAITVIPSKFAADVYYRARDKLFERLFGSRPVPVQGISENSVEILASGEYGNYPIAVNTAAQCYVKLGGTGSAVWVLDEAADKNIPGLEAGSSCYAYHDVSRRAKMKASATAYSAMTDSYGRYIATGSKPIGGEKLTPEGFHDILVELIQKVSAFSKKFNIKDPHKKFNFKRLVFAKDGFIRYDEAEMMERVILEGIPEEGKSPISELLKKIPLLPDELVIDIVSVNKSPNKRVVSGWNGNYKNVPEGTAISYNGNTGLLISSFVTMGTAQPIEIKLHGHYCINMDDIGKPHISEIMDEYYRMTYLDWASVFKQGKYSLPQILTQNLGENISAGVTVPEDMVLL